MEVTMNSNYDFIQQYHEQVAAVKKPSIMQRFTGWLTAAPAEYTAQAVSPWQTNPMFADISHWQKPVNYTQLKFGGMQAVIIKAMECEIGRHPDTWGDAMFATHVQGVYDVGLPYGAYIYLNPQWGLDVQYSLDDFKLLERKDNREYQKFRDVMRNKARPGCYVIDLERWYASTNKYLQLLRGEIPASSVGIISPNWIMADLQLFIRHLTEGMRAGELPATNLVIYTGDWFVKSYMRLGTQNLFYNQAPNWEAAGIKLWTAKYPWSGVICSWEKLLTNYRPDNVNQKPDLCNFSKLSFWQIGVFTLPMPGTPTGTMRLDINLSLMPQAEFAAFFGAPPPVVVPPAIVPALTDAEKLKRLWDAHTELHG
jgi:hypothetical protein